MKIKLIFLFAILLISNLSIAQTFILDSIPEPVSDKEYGHYLYSEEMTQKIKDALDEKNLRKAHYYIYEWSDKSKGVNANFHILFAQYCVQKKDYNCARKHYDRAYNKYDCYVCIERLKDLPKE